MRDGLYKPSERMRDLQILDALHENPTISQRDLSHRVNIALGLTNAVLRRMARKGWIKLKNIPPRRIAYYVTPQGFAEKAKLTMDFMSYTVRHYAVLKNTIGRKLMDLQEKGVRRSALCGAGDETEVALVTLQGTDLELVGIFEHGEPISTETVGGHRVGKISDLPGLQPEAILITDIGNANAIREALRAHVDGTPVLTIAD